MTERVPDDFFLRVTPAVLAEAGVAEVGPAVPTQVARPWRATWRTVVQVGLPAFLIFAGVLPEILQTVLDGMGDVLPDGLRLWLLGAAAVVTAAAGTLARIAAIPAVNNWLKVLSLSADGRGRHAG
jgi:hypothetical protein